MDCIRISIFFKHNITIKCTTSNQCARISLNRIIECSTIDFYASHRTFTVNATIKGATINNYITLLRIIFDNSSKRIGFSIYYATNKFSIVSKDSIFNYQFTLPRFIFETSSSKNKHT